MEISKFIEEVKAKTLYESKNEESLARDILDEWETNKRLNFKMARLVVSSSKIESCFRGVFKEKLSDILFGVDTAFRSVDGWAIMQAISAEGQRAEKEKEEKKGIIERLGL